MGATGGAAAFRFRPGLHHPAKHRPKNFGHRAECTGERRSLPADPTASAIVTVGRAGRSAPPPDQAHPQKLSDGAGPGLPELRMIVVGGGRA